MKSIAVMAVLFFALSTISRADSYVSVDFLPHTFNPNSTESEPHTPVQITVGVSFLWDTTTNTLSDFNLTQSGAINLGLNSFPSAVNITGPNGVITLLNFSNPVTGDLFQFNTGLHELYTIGSTPGTYTSDLFLECHECVYDQDFGTGTAIVSASSGPPVGTPEPGTLVLLSAGLFGLILLKRS
jgi:hypothetical protein